MPFARGPQENGSQSPAPKAPGRVKSAPSISRRSLGRDFGLDQVNHVANVFQVFQFGQLEAELELVLNGGDEVDMGQRAPAINRFRAVLELNHQTLPVQYITKNGLKPRQDLALHDCLTLIGIQLVNLPAPRRRRRPMLPQSRPDINPGPALGSRSAR